jgi:hypothetical protein
MLAVFTVMNPKCIALHNWLFKVILFSSLKFVNWYIDIHCIYIYIDSKACVCCWWQYSCNMGCTGIL